MVRSVLVDEVSLEDHVNSLFRRKVTLEVGLIIGKISSSSKDLILAVIPTPPTSEGDPPAKVSRRNESQQGVTSKKGKGRGTGEASGDSSLLELEDDWIAEHARQTSRMLLGGMQVLGIYIFAPDGTFKISAPVLWQAVKAVSESSGSLPRTGKSTPSMLTNDPLLLHICSSPKRFTCRTCNCSSTFSSSSLRPCDFKFGKVLGNFHNFSCTYSVDIRIAVARDTQKNSRNSLRSSFEEALAKESSRLAKAYSIVDGELAIMDKQLGSGGTINTSHNVDFLVSPTWEDLNDDSGNEKDKKQFIGLIHLKGEVFGYSYANPRETFGNAVSDLKGDIIGSLRARLDLLVDEAEQALEEEGEEGEEEEGEEGEEEEGEEGEEDKEVNIARTVDSQGGDIPKKRDENPMLSFSHNGGRALLVSPFVSSMPRRILVPWRNNIFVGDYLMPEENVEDSKERCCAMLSLPIPKTEILKTNIPLSEIPKTEIPKFAISNEYVGGILEPEKKALSLPKPSHWSLKANFSTSEVLEESKDFSNLKLHNTSNNKKTFMSSLFFLGFLGSLIVLLIAIAISFLGKKSTNW